MKARPLVLLVVLVALFVFFEDSKKDGTLFAGKNAGAGQSNAPLGNGASESANADSNGAANGSSQWNASPSLLKRQDDGHFYADVIADGASLRMLVDTGASVVALTGKDAMAMGIRWNSTDVAPVARGANGEVNGVHVTIKRIDLGSLTVKDVQAVVIPEGLHISLLGQSFLNRLPRMEVTGDTMQLGRQ